MRVCSEGKRKDVSSLIRQLRFASNIHGLCLRECVSVYLEFVYVYIKYFGMGDPYMSVSKKRQWEK